MRVSELVAQSLPHGDGPKAVSHIFPALSLPDEVTAGCVTTIVALEQLAPDWRELFQRIGCRNPFLSHEWVTSWWRHWGGHHRLLVITIRNRVGRLVAVAPFAIQQSRLGKWGPRALSFITTHAFIGSYHLNLLMDPEYEAVSIQAIASMVEQRRTEWDFIAFTLSDQVSTPLKRFCDRLRSAGMTEKIVETQSVACPYAELPPSFEEYLKGVGSNVRYNFRRRRRALEREGIEFVALKERGEILGQFGELFRLHRLRFEGRGIMNSDLLRSGVYEFHLEAAAQLAESGMASLLLLKVRGQAIAALYGFSAGKTFSFYQAGMDPAWARLSVGLVMMGCSIEEAIRSGHDEYDFLGGANPYKFQWANKVRQDGMTCLFDGRARSQLAWSGIGLVDRLRKMKRWNSLRNSDDPKRDEAL
jgi:CelD/BcsL family acetyltransferase involved in cellulose biosynthesis